MANTQAFINSNLNELDNFLLTIILRGGQSEGLVYTSLPIFQIKNSLIVVFGYHGVKSEQYRLSFESTS